MKNLLATLGLASLATGIFTQDSLAVVSPCIGVDKEVACLATTNSCGVFSKLARGVQGTQASGTKQQPAFCFQVTITNCGNVSLTNVNVIDDMYGDLTPQFVANGLGAAFPAGGSLSVVFSVELGTTNNSIFDVTNTVTASGQATTSSGVFAASSAVAEVVPASVRCEKNYTIDGGPLTNNVTIMDSNPHTIVWYLTVATTGAANSESVVVTDTSTGPGCQNSYGPFRLDAGSSETFPLCTNAAYLCSGTNSVFVNTISVAVTNFTLGTNRTFLCAQQLNGSNITATSQCEATINCLPCLTCPTNIVVPTDPGQCSAVVTFSAGTNCPSVTIVCNPPSGSTFPKGTNAVYCIATNSSGYFSTCSFDVIVQDNEGPAVSCRPAPNPSGKISIPGKNGATGVNPNGYYELLSKDGCDPSPSIYVMDTGSSFIAGPFHDGDIVRVKHAGGAPSSVPGTAPVVAVISLKGNGLTVAVDANGNVTPNSAGCLMQVSLK